MTCARQVVPLSARPALIQLIRPGTTSPRTIVSRMYRRLALVALLAVGALAVLEAQRDSAADPAPAPTAQSLRIDERIADASRLRRKGDYTAAWVALTSLDALRPAMSPYQRGLHGREKGVVRSGRGQYEESLEELWAARRTLAPLADTLARREWYNTFINVGLAYYEMGDYPAARDTLLYAGRLAATMPEIGPRLARFVYNNLGQVYSRLGDEAGALAAAQESLRLLRASGLGQSRSAGIAHNTIATQLRLLGRVEEAIEHYRSAAGIFAEVFGKDNVYTLAALGNLAEARTQEGELEGAIPVYARVLELLERDRSANQRTRINAQLNLARIYRRLGRYPAARAMSDAALASASALYDEPHLAKLAILRSIALIQGEAGDYATARATLAAAKEVAKALDRVGPRERVSLLHLEANIVERLEGTPAALPYYRAAAGELDALPYRGFASGLDMPAYDYARVLTQVGTPHLALAALARTRAALDTLAGRLTPRITRRATAALAVERARATLTASPREPLPPGAVDSLGAHLRRAVSSAYRVRGRENQRATTEASYSPSVIAQVLIEHGLRDARAGGSAGDDERERAALRRVVLLADLQLDYLRQAWRGAREQRTDPATARELRALRQRLAALETELYGLSAEGPGAPYEPGAPDAHMIDSIVRVQQRIDALLPVDASEFALEDEAYPTQHLGENTALLYVVNGIADVYAVTQRGDVLAAHPLVDYAGFERAAAAFSAWSRDPYADPETARAGLRAGSSLYGYLVRTPGLAESPRIVVVGSGPVEGLALCALPVSADPEPASRRAADYAVSRHVFEHAATARGFFAQRARRVRYDGGRAAAFAPVQRAESLGADDALDPLPHAETEARAVAELLGGRAYVGEEATLAALAAQPPSTEVLHLASHAVSNGADGEYSFLILSDTSGAGGRRVYGRELRELDLPQRLVVLSTCESGAGGYRSGEGATSLATVFREAGAEAVVNTLWKVEDRFASQLVEEFYVGLTEGERPSEALAQAQRNYLAETGSQFVHPYYWAPFRITGALEGRAGSSSLLFAVALCMVLFLAVGVVVARRR